MSWGTFGRAAIAATVFAAGAVVAEAAPSAAANQTVKAKVFYTKDDDGLSKEWWGRVWLNPPYSQPLIDH